MHEEECDYYRSEYYELARQRANKWQEIKESIQLEAKRDFNFKKWCRAVKWCYSNHPLCTIGSLQDSGGRFNIGKVHPDLIPTFSALYLAEDKKTAETELLTLSNISFNFSREISLLDLSLTNKSSISTVFVSGKLNLVFDLRNDDSLYRIIKILKTFKFSTSFKRKSQKLGKTSIIIQTKRKLFESIMEPHWRYKPIQFDIPSNSQIFGQIVQASGVSGILYYSKHTKKECLAVFPNKFKHSSSFIALIDEPPNQRVPSRIDSSNFNICEAEIKYT